MSQPPAHVRVRREGPVGHLTLNRPEALNALTPAMVTALHRALSRWRDDSAVEVVLLDGEGPRAFCAGGDIRFVRDHAASHPARVLDFWRAEYLLDHLIATYPKPVVTVAHGITMGGGVGLAGHASHRIVASSVALAMPEVLIGLSPDVAGLYLLARSPGLTGVHAALTGSSFGSVDAVAMGFADAVVPDEEIPAVCGLLAEHGPDELLARRQRPDVAGGTSLLARRDWIDDVYERSCLAATLQAMAGHERPEARAAGRAVRSASPTAVVVAREAIRRAGQMTSMAQCLAQDFRVSARFLRHHDLTEGIRARVVDKDRDPHWSPDSVTDVDPEDVAGYFAPLGEITPELWPAP